MNRTPGGDQGRDRGGDELGDHVTNDKPKIVNGHMTQVDAMSRPRASPGPAPYVGPEGRNDTHGIVTTHDIEPRGLAKVGIGTTPM